MGRRGGGGVSVGGGAQACGRGRACMGGVGAWLCVCVCWGGWLPLPATTAAATARCFPAAGSHSPVCVCTRLRVCDLKFLC